MTTHNPIQAIQQLQSILSSPSKKIGFLFGAGISMKDIDNQDLIYGSKKMTTEVVSKFSNIPQKTAIESMKTEIKSENKEFLIEPLLSKISEKERATGSEKLCGLTKDELKKLREDIEEEIRKLVSIHTESDFKGIENTNHNTFSKWVSNANRDYPIEIFTTNYDYLLELALEKQKIPYFDGFVGSYEAFFCPERIENDSSVKDWVKLWKLHGSLGWSQNANKTEIIRTSGENGKAMIYPSFLKYNHSKKQPYLSYMDRLSYFLKQEDSVLFVCGYSFGDEHINDIILTSLTRSRSSHVFVLKSGELKEDDFLSKEISQKNSKVSVYAKNNAVIGCKFGEWRLDRKPDRNESYNILDYGFDEEATPPKDKKATSPEDGQWTGKGDFSLGDFKKFTTFLSLFYNNSKYLKNEK